MVSKTSHFPRDLQVEITETDIERGRKNDPAEFPFSRAIRRTLRQEYNAKSVSAITEENGIVVSTEEGMADYYLGKNGREFMKNYAQNKNWVIPEILTFRRNGNIY